MSDGEENEMMIKVILSETPARPMKPGGLRMSTLTVLRGRRFVAKVYLECVEIFCEEQEEIDGEWKTDPDPDGESATLGSDDIDSIAEALALLRGAAGANRP